MTAAPRRPGRGLRRAAVRRWLAETLARIWALAGRTLEPNAPALAVGEREWLRVVSWPIAEELGRLPRPKDALRAE